MKILWWLLLSNGLLNSPEPCAVERQHIVAWCHGGKSDPIWLQMRSPAPWNDQVKNAGGVDREQLGPNTAKSEHMEYFKGRYQSPIWIQ